MDVEDICLPAGVLDVGAEVARSEFSAVHDATLRGVRVCAKVRSRRLSTLDGCRVEVKGAWEGVPWEGGVGTWDLTRLLVCRRAGPRSTAQPRSFRVAARRRRVVDST
jgi:hypothetical protein